MIKSTKATKIYRDDRTFTLRLLKLEFSFFPKDVVSESFLGWRGGREGGAGREFKKKKKANHPIRLRPQSLRLRRRRRPHLWKVRRVSQVSDGSFRSEKAAERVGT